MKIFLLRHASTSDSEEKINGGANNTPLSELGHKQAEGLVPFLAQHSYDVVFVSPLVRTIQTVAPFLETLKVKPDVVTDALITERNIGIFLGTKQGHSGIHEDVARQGGDRISWKPENGESILDVAKRAEAFLAKLRAMKDSKKSVLVCSHRIFLRSLELLVLQRPLNDFYSDNPPALEPGEIKGLSL